MFRFNERVARTLKNAKAEIEIHSIAGGRCGGGLGGARQYWRPLPLPGRGILAKASCLSATDRPLKTKSDFGIFTAHEYHIGQGRVKKQLPLREQNNFI